MTRCAIAAVGALVAAGCSSDPEVLPALGHVLLYVDTDAPLPPAPGVSPDPEAVPPLFDRLAVAIFAPGATAPCAGCEREFDFHAGLAGGAFSVEPEGPRSGILVRLRMYRRQGTLGGDPRPEATVEAVVGLPEIPEEGALAVHVLLPTDGVGVPAGTLEAPVPAEKGPLHGSRIGTWPGALRVPCTGAAAPGEVCIPGGAAWMGNPLAIGDATTTATKQRLIVLSPYWLDSHETTSAELRAAGLAPLGAVVPWTGKSIGADLEDYCTYTPSPDPTHDGLAVNCVAWHFARDICHTRGAELPTEAQLEYAGGALRSGIYVWGFDEPHCTDAVWGRGPGSQSPCGALLAPGTLGGPVALVDDGASPPPEPRVRDVIELEGGRVFDLAGNLSEWALDAYQRQDEPCWSQPGSNVYVDPLCQQPGVEGARRPRRGGSWIDLANTLRASFRDAISDDVVRPEVGFRCARPAR